jgi:16S rRNA (adenine1518-N6/adenine1519-N6)-dimethyltransferase
LHQARKRFGQHFLRDVAVIERIVDAVDPQVGDRLLEIGPGLGALTTPLLDRCKALHVIELDRDLAKRWRGVAGVDVIEADVLNVDVLALAQSGGAHAGEAPAKPLRVVGNLPYNISTPILFHLAKAATHVKDQHVMLQKEVVDRMVAKPSTKAYGRLSVMLQWRYAMQTVIDVPPQAFEPPPKVDSAVVVMRPRPVAQLQGLDEALLGELVTCAFSQRRKILRHTLLPWLRTRGIDAGFDATRRAEEVSVDEYLTLAQRAQAAKA